MANLARAAYLVTGATARTPSHRASLPVLRHQWYPPSTTPPPASTAPHSRVSSSVPPSSPSSTTGSGRPSLTFPPHSPSSPPPPTLPSSSLPSPLSIPLPSLSIILHANVPTLQHVPKKARDRWALILSDCLSAVVSSPDDLSQWSRLFMLPKCVLASPATGHRLRWREILKLVKSRLQRWSDGDLATFWAEALKGGRSLATRREVSLCLTFQQHLACQACCSEWAIQQSYQSPHL